MPTIIKFILNCILLLTLFVSGFISYWTHNYLKYAMEVGNQELAPLIADKKIKLLINGYKGEKKDLEDTKKFWQERLELQDWIIYVIHEKNQAHMLKNSGVDTSKYIIRGDVNRLYNQKIAYIRLYDLDEMVLVHELIHVAYPKFSEEKVVDATDLILKTVYGGQNGL